MIKKNEVTGFLAFFKFPKPFIYDDKYKNLSNNAKVMYMLLFGRLELSIKNGWHDKEGNVFQYYTNEQLMVDLNSSEKTIIKFKKELKDVGLLEEVRQGNNLPNRIYISAVDGAVNSTVSELENLQYGTVKNTVSELEKLQTNKTENNKTDKSNNIDIVSEVILYLNQVAGTRFTAGSQATQKHINARLKEGYTLEDFKQVIDTKTSEWQGTEFAKFLRPVTLFGTKFENYINQQPLRSRKNNVTEVDERLGF
ncbi:TPA: conserved phage C-terminal domain-containing protein [Streptococcus suis]|nr:conserved phage C-terminal domain-containing protein [Streptococcus suis]HEM5234826.1 conserved phage C-terminal domain-containing protein [Streptococcus suis]HEM5241855.1 conserved phage C-terminal domain-containing protein [Streptococcus suis]